MSRENAQAKGLRYLTEGRLTLERVDAAVIQASCRGAGDVYALGWDGSRWWCDCPAKSRCAHLVALQAVTIRKGSSR